MTHDTFPELEAMRQGVVYRFPVRVRGFEIGLRPLAISETIQVAANVVEKYKALPLPAQTGAAEHTILAKETLKYASQSDYGVGDFKLNDSVMDRWTSDELQAMFKQYVGVTDKCNPQLEVMGNERLNDIVEDLKKNSPEELRLRVIELSSLELVNLVAYLLTKGD